MKYFDENILAILANLLPDELDNDYINEYNLGILRIIEESILIFNALKEKNESYSFLEQKEYILIAVDDEEPLMDKILKSIDIMCENEDFSSIYNTLIFNYHKDLVQEALKTNPEVLDNLESYINEITDELYKLYLTYTLTPDSSLEDVLNVTKRINE